MADTNATMRDILHRLEEAERKLAGYEAARAPRRRGPRGRRGGGRLGAALALALLMALVPLSMLAASPFLDLTGGVHDPNIEAIYDAGVTKGCVPDTLYCPTDNVTREEMASFLARLGGLGENKPVARAARLGITNPTATSATYAADELVRATQATVSTSLALTNTAQVYGPILTITAPSAGFVLVNSVTKFTYVSGTCSPCNSTAVVRHVQSGTQSTASAVAILGIADYRIADPIAWAFPVQAGVNTFEIQVRKSTLSPGTGVVEANAAFSTALFVPFGSTGGSALGVTDPTAPSSDK